MTAYFPLMKRRMANQSNPYLRLRFSYSLQTLSCFMTFIILLQGPMISIAQPNQVRFCLILLPINLSKHRRNLHTKYRVIRFD